MGSSDGVQLGVVVPHSHWDRAWYLPFQAYRLRLVEMLSELLGWLEDGSLPVFVLDGQTVLLDDVFAVRPDLKERVTVLVKQGKIKIGPWYTMPDLFLARPESLIRNLQRGVRMSTQLGGASRVGYVPDSFGHFAQLPQLLAGMGITQFLFMRGMPEHLRDSSDAIFQWRAPNGSAVLAVFLREGYFPLGALGQESFHGRYDGLPANLSSAEERLNHTMARLQPVQKHSVFVLPAGGDHLPARSDLPEVIEHLNRTHPQLRLEFGSFESFFEHLSKSGGVDSVADFMKTVSVYEGDLLGQADHPLLRNVLSSRVDLKIMNHQAQTLLLGVVEPLLAWSRLNNLDCVDPALLLCAWDALFKNHAHDDICGCSVDEVHLDDTQRFYEILALSREIITRQLERGAQQLWGEWPQGRRSKVVVFNPHPWQSEQLVTADILLPDEGGEFSEPSPAKFLRVTNASGDVLEVTHLETHCKDIRSRYLETTWGRSYRFSFKASLPALSLQVYSIEETDEALFIPCPSRTLVPHPPTELIDAIRFDWDADIGDGYSFAPVPEIATRTAQLVSVEQESLNEQVLFLNYVLKAPAYINRSRVADGGWNACLGPIRTMKIEVQARRVVHAATGQVSEEPLGACWELKVNYHNIFSDCRIRFLHALSQQPVQVIADSQARWQEHSPIPAAAQLWPGPLAVPQYPGEKPYTVHHVNDGVVSVLPQGLSFVGGAGLHEFELVQWAPAKLAVALTLQRSVSSLSVRGGRIRSCQAGPQRPTPDAQLLKPLSFHLVFGSQPSSDPARAFRKMKELLEPAWVQESPAVPVQGVAHTQYQGMSLADFGPLPLQLLSCRPGEQDKEVLLRVLNPTANRASGLIRMHGGVVSAQEMLLDDQTPVPNSEIEMKECGLQVEFAPYEIKTWKLSLC